MRRWPLCLAIVAALTGAASPLALPPEVAGVPLPSSPLVQKAIATVRAEEPDFLFNHSVRTYLFGAYRLRQRKVAFDPDTAFVAALFHDTGLIAAGASPRASFEVDGATAAEAFVRANGGTDQQARTVWNAVAMHDMPGAYAAHQSPEAMLVGAGAGIDVDGAPPALVPAEARDAILAAFPRAGFKQGFVALASDHCRRKPLSQIGWLDELCRAVAPGGDRGSVEAEIRSAPYAE